MEDYINEELDFEGNETDYMNERPKNKRISRVIMVQAILCLLLLTGLGGMKFMIPQTFDEVKNDLSLAFNGEEFKKGIQSVCQGIIDQINKLTPLGSDTNQNSTEQSIPQEVVPNSTEINNNINTNEAVEAATFVQMKKEEFLLPVNAKVTSPFGERLDPITNKKDFHYGVDLGASEGTEIKAIADGVISEVTSTEKSGNYFYIDHQNGILSLYAHCSEIMIKAGDKISQGQVVGKVGHTGQVTGPHLHLGIKKDGSFINPNILFPGLG